MAETLEDRVIRHEGCVLQPYLDTEGHWTIGIGHLLTPLEARALQAGITMARSVELLHEDLAHAQNALIQALPWVSTVSQLRREVLIEMAFNLGLAGLLGFRRTLAFAQSGQWVRCSTEVLLSKWATQVKGRAVELAQLLRQG